MPTSTEEMTDQEVAADILKEIRIAEKHCHEAAVNLAEIKEEAKNAKSKYETCVASLRSLCRARSGEHPLFEQNGDGEKPTDSEQDNERWRTTTVEELGLSDSICKKLEEFWKQESVTLGDIADWCNEDHALTDITGIGEAKAEKIQQAMDAFWETYDTSGEQPEDDPEDDGPDDNGPADEVEFEVGDDLDADTSDDDTDDDTDDE